MSGQKPPSWFTKQEVHNKSGQDDPRRAKLNQELPGILARLKDQTRSKKFLPYLLVRSVLGDRGDRPINVPFWESPDIWTAPGDPATSPAVPPTHGGTAVVGQPNTIYAHVWNLGFAPLAGVCVEFYVFDPSLGIDGAHAGPPIGVARCELAGRGMQGSHQLVKCPKAWVPVLENGGHECIVVRVSGIGDPVGNNPWSPWLNRHVAQRNVAVVEPGPHFVQLVNILDRSLVASKHLQLIQVGAMEGAHVARLVAPKLTVAAAVQTHVLGEITATGTVALPRITVATAGMLAPVHALAAGVPQPAPAVQAHGSVAVLDALRVTGTAAEAIPKTTATAAARFPNLIAAIDKLHPGTRLDQPPVNQAYVLRAATFDGKQLIGGYTFVIQGPKQ